MSREIDLMLAFAKVNIVRIRLRHVKIDYGLSWLFLAQGMAGAVACWYLAAVLSAWFTIATVANGFLLGIQVSLHLRTRDALREARAHHESTQREYELLTHEAL